MYLHEYTYKIETQYSSCTQGQVIYVKSSLLILYMCIEINTFQITYIYFNVRVAVKQYIRKNLTSLTFKLMKIMLNIIL